MGGREIWEFNIGRGERKKKEKEKEEIVGEKEMVRFYGIPCVTLKMAIVLYFQ